MWALYLLLFGVCLGFEIKGMTFTGDKYCKEKALDSESSFRSLKHLKSTGKEEEYGVEYGISHM